MIIHIGTEVKTIFGVVDEAGNLVKEIPIGSQRLASVGPNELAAIGSEMAARRRQLQDEEGLAQTARAAAVKKAQKAAAKERAIQLTKEITERRNGQPQEQTADAI